jgi:tetratricopeptide (TPR) repeat protein
MTSRNPHCGYAYGTFGHVELDGLDEDGCIELLRKSAQLPDMPPHSKSDARSLVKTLGHHTLAILHAGTYIAQSGHSISKYAEFLNTSRQRLLGESKMGQSQARYKTVYATIQASMEFLESQDIDGIENDKRDAIQLLELLSMLHYESAPLYDIITDAWHGAQNARTTPKEWELDSGFLTAWHAAQAPDMVKTEKDETEMRISEAVARLESLALVRRDRSAREWRSVSMHPLVHTWARDRQSQQDQKATLRMSECAVVLAHYYKDGWSPYYGQFRPHLIRLIDLDVDLVVDGARSRCILQVCVAMTRILDWIGFGVNAYNLSNQIFQELKLDNKEPTEDLREVYFLAARAKEDSGRPEEAVALSEAVKRLDEKSRPENDRLRLRNLRILGDAYQTNGQIKQAVALLEEVVQALEQFGEEDGDLLLSKYSLAYALDQDRRYPEAIELVETVVSIRSRLLQRNDPNRLSSEQLLGVAYLHNRQLAEATRTLEDVAQRYAQTFGEENLHTAYARAPLAEAYKKTGRLLEAIQLQERVVSVIKSQLHETRPDLLTSQHNLASVLLEAGRITEAIHILEWVVKVGRPADGQGRYRWKQQSEDLLARAYEVREGRSQRPTPATSLTATGTDSEPKIPSTENHVSIDGNMGPGDAAELRNGRASAAQFRRRPYPASLKHHKVDNGHRPGRSSRRWQKKSPEHCDAM